MSYKAGDVVRIVPEEVIRQFRPARLGTDEGWISPEGWYIDSSMLSFCGRYVTITGRFIDSRLKDGTYPYHVKECFGWSFPESCFDDGFSSADFSGLEELL